MGEIMGCICAMYIRPHIIQQQKTAREYSVKWKLHAPPIPPN